MNDDTISDLAIPTVGSASSAGIYELSNLTKNQLLMWAEQKLLAGTPVFNNSFTFTLVGELDPQHFQKAFQAVVDGSDALRTVFREVDGIPQQSVLSKLPYTVEFLDFSKEASPEVTFRSWVRDRCENPFDLGERLFDSVLLKTAAKEFVWYLNLHHLISDGWTFALIYDHVSQLYGRSLRGQLKEVAEDHPTFQSYLQDERAHRGSTEYAEASSYWKEKLSGHRDPIRFYGKPPSSTTAQCARVSCNLGVERTKSLRSIAAAAGTGVFPFLNIFATLVFAYLYRISGNRALAIGTTFHNRRSDRVKKTIGLVMEAVPLQVEISVDETFFSLMEKVGPESYTARRHCRYAPGNPLNNRAFEVMLTYHNSSYPPFSGMPVRVEIVHYGMLNESLALHVHDFAETGELTIDFEFNREVFDERQCRYATEHFLQLVDAFLRDQRQSIDAPCLLSAEEKKLLLVTLNETEASRAPATIVQLFESQVEGTPEAVAVEFEGNRLSYRELNERANQLAHYLRGMGVRPDTLVGVAMERSLEMVVALYGILKAGGAYVPIDPEYPRERVAFMLQDANVAVLLTQGRLAGLLPSHNGRVVCVDGEWERIACQDVANPAGKAEPNHLAYMIYTSGSTGRPKGAMNTHRGISNRLLWMQDQYGLTQADKVLQKTPFSFDVSVWEFFWPLLVGARLMVAEPGGHRDAAYLVKLIREQGITVLHFVPSMLRAFLEESGAERCHSLRHVICSGEALPYDLQEQFFRSLSAQLHNLYGPTEAAVDVTHWTCRRHDERKIVPIGRPVANTQIYILDQRLQPTPIGVPGELYIGGVQVGRGYHNRPELTAEKFIPDPFSGGPEARLYKTGDLCRWLADGAIEYLGRMDFQVKIRGFRIELGEIEEALRQHPGVREAIVVAREDTPGDKRLVGYVVPKPDYHPDGSEVDSDAEHVGGWQAIFEDTYTQTAQASDHSFDIVGWNSSYTGKPIPAEEMRTWVDTTVERIRALRPQHVWEIGCGTGLLLHRLASHCALYYATDYSANAVRTLQRQIAGWDSSSPHVVLRQANADDFTGIAPESFDLVILNSVAQYFPSVDYLVRVLEGAVRAVTSGGAIFLGDVRSEPLLNAFHAAVQLEQATASLPSAGLRQRIQRALSQENELAINPSFFNALRTYLPAITQVEIQLKRGRHHNELNLFRYDVVLRVGTTVQSTPNWISLDWQQGEFSVSDLHAYLTEGRPVALTLTGVPNARLQRERKLLEILASPECPATAGELREALDAEGKLNAIEPEDLWTLGESLGYIVQVRWPGDAVMGLCDVVFLREEEAAEEAAHAVFNFPGEPSASKPWSAYANNPLQGILVRKLVPELRELLGKKLPEHMMPSVLTVLDTLPLAPNGKVDRKALPLPEQQRPELASRYVAPRTTTESKLVAIWSKILGLQQVGVNDNFFELGGDSILSIQVVSLAQRERLKLTLKQMFTHQTVSELAAIADVVNDAQSMQETLTGDVPLLPIQQWFFEQNLDESHHYNQALLFEAAERIDRRSLELALKELSRQHDSLRLRYVHKSEGWRQFYSTSEEPTPLTWVDDHAQLEEVEQRRRVESIAASMQASLDLERGPLWRVVYFDLGSDQPGRLLFVVHHLAVDGISWRLLLEDLETAYDQLKAGKAVQLPAKTASYKGWAERLRQFAGRESLQSELGYWKAVTDPQYVAGAVEPLAVDERSSKNTEGSTTTLTVSLTVDRTKTLLQKVPPAYNTQINDVLLTALARAWSRWTGSRVLFLNLEGHGRENLFEDLDLSRTVGWLTSIFPVRLELGESGDHWRPDEALKSVKEQLRRIPQRGIGYGILRYFEADAGLNGRPEPPMVFNYLGQFDQVLGGSRLFRFAHESTGPWHSQKQRRRHALEVNALVIEGRLEVRWTYNPYLHSGVVRRLADEFLIALEELIIHCQSPNAFGRTPSDFPLARLDQSTLDRLVTGRHDVEDIYPLSPIQTLFFVANSGAAPSAAFDQWHCTLLGNLNVSAFKRAWQETLQRHTVLRSTLHDEGLRDPVQIVHREVCPSWAIQDWRGLPSDEHAERWSALLRQDRAQPLALTEAPAMRFTLVRLGSEVWKFLWSVPALLLDGWSWPLVFRDVSRLYGAFSQNRMPQLELVRPYRDYLEWLGKQSPGEAQEFWRESLAGFREPTPLPDDAPQENASGERYLEHTIQLSTEKTYALQFMARRLQVTLNALVQGSWALLLRRQSRCAEIIFGSAFAGRPPDLPGVESIVGPFVNNLPVRVTVNSDAKAGDFFRHVHGRLLELTSYQYTPLMEIHRASEIPWRHRLFDSVIVFQNYLVDESARCFGGHIEISDFGGPVHTNYPVMLLATPGEAVKLELVYDRLRIAPTTIERWGHDLTLLLEQLPFCLEKRVGDLEGLLSLPAIMEPRGEEKLCDPSLGYVAPRTEMERTIERLWAETLGLEQVGVNANFFRLGGHSLTATQLISRIRGVLGMDVPLRTVFETPTVAGFAKYIEVLRWASLDSPAVAPDANRTEVEL